MICKAAAALLGLLVIAPASAAARVPDGIAVPYGDLDLRSAAGQGELKARITQAASTLCYTPWMARKPDSEFSIHYRQQIYRACLGRVTNRAMAKIGAGTQGLPDL